MTFVSSRGTVPPPFPRGAATALIFSKDYPSLM